MSRTPFGTPFRNPTERFPDQTRPDQRSLVTSADVKTKTKCLAPEDTWRLILAGLTLKGSLTASRPRPALALGQRDTHLLGRWLSRTVEADDGCWIWQGATFRGGYGAIAYEGSTTTAHRVIYRLMVAEVPRHIDLDHLCRIRLCVNPYHLEPVSRSVNLTRGAHPTQGRHGRGAA